MKHTALFFALIFFSVQFGFGQWSEIGNLDNWRIRTLNFIDDDLGYVLVQNEVNNNKGILKTINGGLAWMELNLPDQTGELQDIFFFEDGEGVLLMRNLGNATVPTMLFRTLDDGSNWEDISPDSTAQGVGVGQCQFLDRDTGFFVSDRYFYATKDGGQSWKSMEFSEYILALDFLDAEHGTLGSWDGRFSYKGGMMTTTDGGDSWQTNLLDDNYTSIVEVGQIDDGVAFAAPVHSWAAIAAGQLFKTGDFGNTWQEVDIPDPDNDATLRQVFFTDELNGVICIGDTKTTQIYSTTDGGETWKQEGEIESVYDLDLQLTPKTGYIAGHTGKLYKRTGITSVKEDIKIETVTLYPVPATNGTELKWEAEKSYTRILITDDKGSTIIGKNIDSNQLLLPELASGIYNVQLFGPSSMGVAQLVIH